MQFWEKPQGVILCDTFAKLLFLKVNFTILKSNSSLWFRNQNDLINYRLKSLVLTLISVVLDFHTHQPVLTSLCIPLFSTLRYTHTYTNTWNIHLHTHIFLFFTKKCSKADITLHCFKFNTSWDILWSGVINNRYFDYISEISNINNIRYADDTTLMAESEELNSLLMKVKGEWKIWLKAQYSEN